MAGKSRLLFLGTGGVSDAVRLILPARELSKKGVLVEIHSMGEFGSNLHLSWVASQKGKFNACLLSRPHDPALVEALKGIGLYVVVDLDDDFHSIPKAHPGYKYVGPGNPKYLENVAGCVYLADALTVTTKLLQERWQELQKDITIIPNGWSKDNPFWGKTYPRETTNLFWGGTITHREDFELALPSLVRIANSYPSVRIVIAGDPQIYQMLQKVPQKQKVFVPNVTYDDYPHSLCYADILLAPLINNDFNNHKSDVKLVDAGAARIPWVASITKQYSSWREGGLFAGEWYGAISWMLNEPDTRAKLAEAGYQRALPREMGNLIDLWENVLL